VLEAELADFAALLADHHTHDDATGGTRDGDEGATVAGDGDGDAGDGTRDGDAQEAS